MAAYYDLPRRQGQQSHKTFTRRLGLRILSKAEWGQCRGHGMLSKAEWGRNRGQGMLSKAEWVR